VVVVACIFVDCLLNRRGVDFDSKVVDHIVVDHIVVDRMVVDRMVDHMVEESVESEDKVEAEYMVILVMVFLPHMG
jgi:hypothetical protein